MSVTSGKPEGYPNFARETGFLMIPTFPIKSAQEVNVRKGLSY